VWSELSKVWDQIDEMKEKTWLSVAPRKLRTQLDALLSQLRDMPARLRHYPSYEFVKKLLQSYAKVCSPVVMACILCLKIENLDSVEIMACIIFSNVINAES